MYHRGTDWPEYLIIGLGYLRSEIVIKEWKRDYEYTTHDIARESVPEENHNQ